MGNRYIKNTDKNIITESLIDVLIAIENGLAMTGSEEGMKLIVPTRVRP
jgi:hypothetical protein